MYHWICYGLIHVSNCIYFLARVLLWQRETSKTIREPDMQHKELMKRRFFSESKSEQWYSQSVPIVESEEALETENYDTILVWNFPSGGGHHFKHDCKEEFNQQFFSLQKKRPGIKHVTLKWEKTQVCYSLFERE